MGILRVTGDHADFWCPACQRSHRVWLGPNDWSYNGDAEAPTFWPSVKVETREANGPVICHMYIIDGHIDYLGDCTHGMKKSRVPMEPLPDEATS